MENSFLRRKANGEKILFSELLENPPPDHVLHELFPYGMKSKTYISQDALKILKLRLDGLCNKKVGEVLHADPAKIGQHFYQTIVKLKNCPDPEFIELDVPGVRRIRGMSIPINNGYTKLSELLRDMPSDGELLELAISRGYIVGFGGRRTLRNDDLLLLQKKADGQSVIEIGKELGVGDSNIYRRLKWIYSRLIWTLEIQIDLPELFPRSITQENSVNVRGLYE